jgi:chromosome segregation ATPase
MATLDELENRTRELGSEVEGEKAVTRYVLEQGRRNTSDLAAIRSELAILHAECGNRFDRLDGDMVLVKAALNSHGARLNTLSQDVLFIRQDATALRRDIEVTNARLDELQQDVTELRRGQEAINARLDTIERNVAAILAAVAPQSPPA